MKKLLFLFTLVILSFSVVKAQTAKTLLLPLQSDKTIHKAGLDTNTNAGTVTQVLQLTGYWQKLTIQAGVTKLTGTLGASGSVKLYGSVDGVKYDFVTTSTDTLAVANVAGTQVKTWKIGPSDFQYFKAIYKQTAGATQSSTITTTALARNP